MNHHELLEVLKQDYLIDDEGQLIISIDDMMPFITYTPNQLKQIDLYDFTTDLIDEAYRYLFMKYDSDTLCSLIKSHAIYVDVDQVYQNLRDRIQVEDVSFAITNESYLEDAYDAFIPYQGYTPNTEFRINLEEGTVQLDDADYLDNLMDYLAEDILLWLIQSQGYTLNDLLTPDHPSTFIQTLRQELLCYDAVLHGYNLTFLVKSLSLTDYERIQDQFENRPSKTTGIRLKAGSTLGLHNFIHGSYCNFNIQLDKDLMIPNNLLLHTSLIGYQPKDVADPSNEACDITFVQDVPSFEGNLVDLSLASVVMPELTPS